jgi:hypothetical protein
MAGVRPGKWLGNNGGGLEITSIANGQLIGRYQTAVGRPRATEWFPAYGATDGVLIGFSVLWKNDTGEHGSLTSWTGRHLDAGVPDGLGDHSRERIEMQWHLARLKRDDDPASPYAMWEIFITNYSVLYFNP